MNRVIIASAASFETDDTIRRLENKGVSFTRLITGVGMAESAMIAAGTRSLVADRDVVFCCTAGIIGGFEGVKLFSASTVKLAPWDVRNFKTELLSTFDPIVHLLPLSFRLPTCDAVCGLGVTVSPELSPNKVEGKADVILLETMELYAVARAWLPLVRSFTAILAVTNATGDRARLDWRSNFMNAAAMTAAFLENAMSGSQLSGTKNV